MSRLVAGHNYDVMDNHADKFKKPDDQYQPRILDKKNSKSKLLASSSFYQPPLRRKKERPKNDQIASETPRNEDENKNRPNDELDEDITEDLENTYGESVKTEPR